MLEDNNNSISKVNDFVYGENQNENLIYAESSLDSNGNVTYNFENLKKFLDESFLPSKVKMKQKKNKETGNYEYFPSIPLNKIIELKLSEKELEYTLNYLKDEGIIVSGNDSTLDSEFENYDYLRTYKNSVLPEHEFSHEEQTQKFKMLRETNDPVLREQLIIDSLRLVPFCAWRLAAYYDCDIHELEQYGYEGLIMAVDKYEPDYVAKFSTYAVPYIRGYILNGIPEYMGFKKNKWSYDYIQAKRVVEEENDKKLENSPELVEDVVDLLIANGSIKPEKRDLNIRRINLINGNLTNEYDESEIIDDNYEDDMLSQYLFLGLEDEIEKTLGTLSEREQKVLSLRFGLEDGEPKSLEEVAREFGVMRERIRQIEAKALRKMRHPSRSKKLKPYLEDDEVIDGKVKTSHDYHDEEENYDEMTGPKRR